MSDASTQTSPNTRAILFESICDRALMVRRRPSVDLQKEETTMTTKSISRLVRLGAARQLTRANSRGEFDELNPVLKYTIPPTE